MLNIAYNTSALIRLSRLIAEELYELFQHNKEALGSDGWLLVGKETAVKLIIINFVIYVGI